MSELFWLRAETKRNEFRRAIVPEDCKKLLNAGHRVVVEDWKDSIIPIDDYKKIGCEISASGSWTESPVNAIIVGLKALPETITSFKNRHIYFAHAYKDQDGWSELISKFDSSGGKVIDLEFMTNKENRRVCAFGYWAGYVGAALGALICNLKPNSDAMEFLAEKKFFANKDQLFKFISENTELTNKDAIVIGSAGRSGSGARDCLETLGWSVVGWDRPETAKGGPFKELLDYDLFVNCVLALGKMPPFIDKAVLSSNQKLKVISDVSCDPDSDCNMVPLYEVATTLGRPYHSIIENNIETKIIAIDNLPSVLPYESSVDFSSQLIEHLVNFDETSIVIKNSLDWYTKTASRI